MAALAYLLPPLTGLFAYIKGSSARVRLHGLQSVTLGLVWPAALYACSWISTGATQVAWLVGALLWLWLLVATLAGKDPLIPGAGRPLRRAAQTSPSAPPRASGD